LHDFSIMSKDLTKPIDDPESESSKTANPKPRNPFGLWAGGRLRSFYHAGRGLFTLCAREPNFQIHLAAAVLAIGFGLFFGISNVEWLVLILTISAALTAEAFNTALERMVDLIHPERHPLARDAKDLAAAAVLTISIAAAVIGLILFAPRILRILTLNPGLS
jgi:diacylglycerol kinase